jgi:CheY-like chemotaxis protein
MKQMLVSAGYSVLIKKSAEEGLEFLQQIKPKFVLSDINLPEMDGYELSRTIKSNPALKDISVILLIAFKHPDELFQSINCCADNFMMKLLKKDYFLPAFELASRKSISTESVLKIQTENMQFEAHPAAIFDMLQSCFETVIAQQRQLADLPGR